MPGQVVVPLEVVLVGIPVGEGDLHEPDAGADEAHIEHIIDAFNAPTLARLAGHGCRSEAPIFVVGMIIQTTGIWNDFLFGVIYTKPDLYPMTVQLNNIVNAVQGVKEYNVNMAATLLTGLVPLVIYFISGKLFVRGIAAGAVKG